VPEGTDIKVKLSPAEAGLHVLVVDDHAEIRDLLGQFLRKHGFRATTVRDAEEARRHLFCTRFDLIVLDIMLPGEDGLSLCRHIRATSAVPIIMLTAMGEEFDRVLGLELGADDYLPKPFSPRELLARMKAVLRRTGSRAEAAEGHRALGFSGWRLDLVRRELTSPAGAVVDLTTGEYELLVALVEHPQRPLSREQLMDMAKSRSGAAFDRSIDVTISRLRRKLGDDHAASPIIRTVRNVGYVFAASVEKR
jgi:two-component system OmpR family response regulator